MIGTLRNMTDSSGSPGTLRVLTAFGESIAGPGIHGAPGRPDRYGYAGEWGYQTDTVADPARRFPFLHVGARYYDPSTGRFLQRDPIGIDGGLNAYVYVLNLPSISIDPSGLGWKLKIAKIYLWTTGGQDSWLDNARTAKKVRRALRIPALVCAVTFLPESIPLAARIAIGSAAGITKALAPW